MTDRGTLKQAQIGTLISKPSSEIADPVAAVNQAHRRTYSKAVQDAATAGTAVTEFVLEHVRRASRVISASVAAPIDVAAAAANIATFNVYKKTGAGAHVLIATGSTVTAGTPGALTALIPAELALTAANTLLAAGDALTAAIVKGSSGVALTAATSYFEISVDVEEV